VNDLGYGDRRDKIGFYGFNNITTAVIAEFVATTMDEWPALSHPLMRSEIATSWLVWPFFACMTMILAILTGNLFVSVICYAFGQLELEQGAKKAAAAAVKKLRVMFDRFDTDGSGNITGEEVGAIAACVGVILSANELKELMDQMDTNDAAGADEDEVDFEEFAHWWRSDSVYAVRIKRAFNAEEHRLKQVFNQVDIDRGGSLDIKEVKEFFIKIGMSLTDDELDAAMADMDPNGDGDIDFDEFSGWWFAGTELSEAVKKASNTEEARIKKMYENLLANGADKKTAEIKFEGLSDLGSTLGVTLTKPEIVDALKEMDEDGGGTVDYEEFSDWWKSSSKIAERLRTKMQRQEAQVRVLFDRLDEDHGGDIGAQELAKISKDIGMAMSEDQIEAMIKEIDEDGGGTIDYDEFMVWWTSDSAIAAKFKEKLEPYLKKEAAPKFPYIPGLSDQLMHLVLHPVFDWIILVLVFANAIIMAMDHYPEPEWLEDFLLLTEYIFCILYSIECLIKIFGLGAQPYFKSGFNRLDFTIVLASILGLFVPALANISAFRGVRILVKMLRIMRMFKLLSKYETVLMLLKTVLGSWTMLSNLIIFIVFCLCIFAVTGMHTLGGCHLPGSSRGEQTAGSPEFPRNNFYTFMDALLTMFQIMSGEDWAPVMYAYMECSGFWAVGFFSVAFCVTNFFLLNLFVAVILMNFEVAEEEKLIKQEARYIKQMTDGVKTEAERNGAVMYLRNKKEGDLSEEQRVAQAQARRALRKARTASGADSPGGMNSMNPDEGEGRENVALGCCGFQNPLRKALIATVNHWSFEAVVLVVIVISSIALAAEGPEGGSSTKLGDAASMFNLAVWAFFMLEFLMKIIALGFIFTPRGYIMDSWNRIDFFILIVSTVDTVSILLDQPSHPATRVLRLLRILRPLRMIKHSEGMRVIVNSLIACANMVLAVLALSMIFYMVFATLGVSMFKGKFASCNHAEWEMIYRPMPNESWSECPWDSSSGTVQLDNDGYRIVMVPKPSQNVTGRCVEPISLSHQECDTLCHFDPVTNLTCWRNPPYHFDNIFAAIKTLFITSTLEGWIDIMYTGMDIPDGKPIPGLELPPRKENFYSAFLFFWTFVILGSYFTTNIFIGVMVNFFSESSGSGLLTESQKGWVMKQLLAKQIRQRVDIIPEVGLRRQLYNLTQSEPFEYFITFLIMLNVMVLVAEHFPQDDAYTDTFYWMNFIFLVIFTIEAIMKIVALNFQQYIVDSWCQLDFFIVTLSWTTTIIENGGGASQIFRALRILRIIMILKNSPSLRSLFGTLVISIPPCANLSALLMMVYFMWGVLGMQFFGLVQDVPGAKNMYLNDLDNFDSIWSSMRVLFQISTGQDWMNIMYEIQVELNFKNPGNDNFHAFGCFVYFGSFYVATVFVFLNLFVAVLLENFEMNFESTLLDISETHIGEYKEVWVSLTEAPKHNSMAIKMVPKLVANLQPENPLRDVLSDPLWFNRMLFELDLSVDGTAGDEQSVTFHELLMVIILLLHSYNGLSFEMQMKKKERIVQRQEDFAARCLVCYVRCWLARRNPPATYFGRPNSSPQDVERYRFGCWMARLMIVDSAVRTNKVAAQSD
jgi:Ca2+-binding EF-hand superfamily protein